MTKEGILLRDSLLIVITALCLFTPFIGSVHLFDWDEVNFAECSREMLLTGNYTRVQINFEPFWEKPPLFFWLQVLSMKVFGVNEFAARFVNVVCGAATLVLVYLIGSRIFDVTLGRLWALAFVGSFLPHIFFKSGIIDPLFNLFIFLGISMLTLVSADDEPHRRIRPVLLGGILIGLAVLTKGPVAFLIAALCIGVYSLVQRRPWVFSPAQLALFCAAAAGVSLVFYGVETLLHGTWFMREFIKYHIRLLTTSDAGHGRPFYFHFVVIFFGCFPASILSLRAFGPAAPPTARQADFRRWMLILFWVVLSLFSLVRTKTVLYSSLTYFPLTFLAAYYMRALIRGDARLPRPLFATLCAVGILIGAAITALPLLMLNKQWLLPHIDDRFAVACLSKPVEWGGWEWMIGAGYTAVMVGCFVAIARKRYAAGLIALLLSSALMLQVYMRVVVPKVESYTQGGPVEFYQELRDRDCYVKSLSKSYADLFYWRKPPGLRPESYDKQWLLRGPIDKPAYFVARSTKAKRYLKNYDVEVVREGYGFTYLRRNVDAGTSN